MKIGRVRDHTSQSEARGITRYQKHENRRTSLKNIENVGDLALRHPLEDAPWLGWQVTDLDAIRRVTMFPQRSGEVDEVAESHLLRRPLAYELSKLITGLFTHVDTQKIKTQAFTPFGMAPYTAFKAESMRNGGYRSVATVGEDYVNDFGQTIHGQDSLAIYAPEADSDIRGGTFIFRAGNNFDVGGEIDFILPDQSDVLAASAGQLMTLTAELRVINERFEAEQAASFDKA